MAIIYFHFDFMYINNHKKKKKRELFQRHLPEIEERDISYQ